MSLQIYTDGSINMKDGKHPGGWSAIFIYENTFIISRNGGVLNTTSQRMELAGAIMGLHTILNEGPEELKAIPFKTIQIVTDSGYLYRCMTEKWYIDWIYNNWNSLVTGEPVKNEDLWKELLNLISDVEKKDYTISFKKIKGHSGVLYNEMADRYAVMARKSVQNGGKEYGGLLGKQIL